MRHHGIRTAGIICILGMAMLPSIAQDDLWHVSIRTTSLITSTAGPFSLAVGLVDGSAIQDGKSSAVVDHLQFGNNGYVMGTPSVFGGIDGSIGSGLKLTNRSAVSYFVQSFHPGKEITFDLSFSAGKLLGGLPSRVTVSILDGSGKPIATLAPAGDYLLGLDLTPQGTSPEVFGSNTAILPLRGGPILIPPPGVDD